MPPTQPPDHRGSTARVAGLLYLVPMVLGPFSMMYVPSRIVVPDDAAATAANLVAHEALFRLGMLGHAGIVLSEVALTAALYVLLAPAGRALSLAAALARLGMTALQAANIVPLLVAVALVTRPTSGVDAAQAPGLALLSIEAHGLGVHVWEVLFALHCLLVGVLVFRSGSFPRPLGVLMGLAAFGYALNGLGNLVAPQNAATYAAIVGLTALIGEVPFALWLLIKGSPAAGEAALPTEA